MYVTTIKQYSVVTNVQRKIEITSFVANRKLMAYYSKLITAKTLVWIFFSSFSFLTQNYDQNLSTNCKSLYLEIYLKIQQEKSTPSKVPQRFFKQVEILKIRKMTESRTGVWDIAIERKVKRLPKTGFQTLCIGDIKRLPISFTHLEVKNQRSKSSSTLQNYSFKSKHRHFMRK